MSKSKWKLKKAPIQTSNPFANTSFSKRSFGNPRLNRNERMQTLKQTGMYAEKEFSNGLKILRQEILRSHPLQLLSALSTYFLFSSNAAPDEWRQQEKLFQHHIEVIQALALKHKWNEFERERTDPQLIIDTIKDVTMRFIHKRGKAVKSSMSTQEVEQFLQRESVRIHTQAVRNWGYPQHVHSILSKLMSKVDDVCERENGLKGSECVELLFKLVSICEARMRHFQERRHECLSKKTKTAMLAAYEKHFEFCQFIERSRFLAADPNCNLQQYAIHLIVCSEFSLPHEVFLTHINEIRRLLHDRVDVSTVEKLLSHWSLSFGDIDTPDDHLFMGNPVRHRPFIKMEDGYYMLLIPGLLISFAQQLIENLFQSKESKRTYEKARAKFLEDEFCRVLQDSFPRGKLFRNSEWISEVDRKTYENDALLIVDRIAFVCEAKSGRVAESARRGGDRLDTEIRDLLIEPSEQANRFIEYLKRHPGKNEFSTREGGVNVIDTTTVDEFIPVTFTLDDLSIRWDSESMNGAENVNLHAFLLSDFQVAMDYLTSETIRLHYLCRRNNFTQRDRFIGDEIDLLAFYMRTKLLESFPEDALYIGSGDAHPIDEYYLKSYEGQKCSKRLIPLTKRWEQLLHHIDAKGEQSGWSAFAKPIFDISYDAQKKLETQIRISAKEIRGGDKPYAIHTLGDGELDRHPLMLFIHSDLGDKLRREATSIAEAECRKIGYESIVVVGIDARRVEKPFTLLEIVTKQAEI